jgi:hypothetical protein
MLSDMARRLKLGNGGGEGVCHGMLKHLGSGPMEEVWHSTAIGQSQSRLQDTRRSRVAKSQPTLVECRSRIDWVSNNQNNNRTQLAERKQLALRFFTSRSPRRGALCHPPSHDQSHLQSHPTVLLAICLR